MYTSYDLDLNSKNSWILSNSTNSLNSTKISNYLEINLKHLGIDQTTLFLNLSHTPKTQSLIDIHNNPNFSFPINFPNMQDLTFILANIMQYNSISSNFKLFEKNKFRLSSSNKKINEYFEENLELKRLKDAEYLINPSPSEAIHFFSEIGKYDFRYYPTILNKKNQNLDLFHSELIELMENENKERKIESKNSKIIENSLNRLEQLILETTQKTTTQIINSFELELKNKNIIKRRKLFPIKQLELIFETYKKYELNEDNKLLGLYNLNGSPKTFITINEGIQVHSFDFVESLLAFELRKSIQQGANNIYPINSIFKNETDLNFMKKFISNTNIIQYIERKLNITSNFKKNIDNTNSENHDNNNEKINELNMKFKPDQYDQFEKNIDNNNNYLEEYELNTDPETNYVNEIDYQDSLENNIDSNEITSKMNDKNWNEIYEEWSELNVLNTN